MFDAALFELLVNFLECFCMRLCLFGEFVYLMDDLMLDCLLFLLQLVKYNLDNSGMSTSFLTFLQLLNLGLKNISTSWNNFFFIATLENHKVFCHRIGAHLI